MNDGCKITKLPHHIQQKLCNTRPPYRQGKRLTSVKVYTINDESKHVVICGVPKLQLSEEVKKLVEPYGDVKRIHVVPDYPAEEFTEAYYLQYARIQSARIAKRFIDGKNFYGGSLHIFYVPEVETVAETKTKLAQRHREVGIRIKRNQKDALNPSTDKFVPPEQYHRKKRTPALPLTEERLTKHYPGETLTSIYNGIPQNIDPRPVSEPSLPSTSYNYQDNESITSATSQAPYSIDEAIIQTTASNTKLSRFDDVKRKKRNYKGQPVDTSIKNKIVRPSIINTSNIVNWDASGKKVFSNPKKVESNITIKLIAKNDNSKKRIVIKDPNVSQLVQPSKDLQLSIQEVKSKIRVAMQAKDSDNSV
ncbi:RNA-binding protein 48 [Lasioglossum baleicum]|uniref:RNA-binding protein 48 n=1 Tax=Lasioglossum baleicum TaxID=434251 RepID=UPI003FCD7FB7